MATVISPMPLPGRAWRKRYLISAAIGAVFGAATMLIRPPDFDAGHALAGLIVVIATFSGAGLGVLCCCLFQIAISQLPPDGPEN